MQKLPKRRLSLLLSIGLARSSSLDNSAKPSAAATTSIVEPSRCISARACAIMPSIAASSRPGS